MILLCVYVPSDGFFSPDGFSCAPPPPPHAAAMMRNPAAAAATTAAAAAKDLIWRRRTRRRARTLFPQTYFVFSNGVFRRVASYLVGPRARRKEEGGGNRDPSSKEKVKLRSKHDGTTAFNVRGVNRLYRKTLANTSSTLCATTTPHRSTTCRLRRR